MKKISLLLVVIFFILACGLPSPILPTPTLRPTHEFAPIATLTPVCVSEEPTQADVDRALAYTNVIFDSPEWERSYNVAQNRVAVTWNNYTQGSVIYLEALIFPCGYEEPDLDDYFSNNNWKIIFENYENYEKAGQCQIGDGLRLYEFDASDEGFDYLIHYWVENDSSTRVIVTMMTFPLESEILLDDYSFQLFPNLESCS